MTAPWVSLIIAGSRTVEPKREDISRLVRDWLLSLVADSFDEPHHVIKEVVCGEATGADLAGKAWAKSLGIPVHSDPVTRADYDKHGSYWAPKMRNRRMAIRATHAILFWDAESGGTCDMCMRMVCRQKPVFGEPMRPTLPKPRRPGSGRSRSNRKMNPEPTPEGGRPD